MKTLIKYILPVIMLTVFSCSKENISHQDQPSLIHNSGGTSYVTNPGSNSEAASFMHGTWSVNLYSDDGMDQTALFQNYNFAFNPDGSSSVNLRKENVSGSWMLRIGANNESEIILDYGNREPFDNLSKTWLLVEKNNQYIRLQNLDGDTEYLTFKRL